MQCKRDRCGCLAAMGVSALAVAGGNPVCLDEGRASFRGVQIGAHGPGTYRLRAEAEGVPCAEVEVLVHAPVPVAVVGAAGSEPQGSLAQRFHQQHQTNRKNQPHGAGDGPRGQRARSAGAAMGGRHCRAGRAAAAGGGG